jgi:hypothetical protein
MLAWRLPAVASLALLVGSIVAGVLLSRQDSPSKPVEVVASSSTASGFGAATLTTEASTHHAARGHDGRARGAPAIAGERARAARPDPVTVSIMQATSAQTIPSGYLGFSFEFSAVRDYTGSDPSHVNPVLVQLIRNLTPSQAPVLRIGGDSTDASYAPSPGVQPPAYVDYPLTPSWLATTSALAKELGARLILGLNLAANEPALAAAEARDYVHAFGRGAIEAMEIGNEPNVYSKVTVLHTVFGLPVSARPRTYDYAAFHRQFDAIAARSPHLALAGPALAIGPTPGPGSWAQSMPAFLKHEGPVSMMTVHRYPLRNCYVPPSSPQYPTIAHLLSSYATVDLADSLKRWVDIAHSQHRLLRVDELNSVACRGKTGVSDTFASALWVTDALFALVHAGVDGIDMHTLPDTAYQLFQFSDSGGRWAGQVQPVYYGLQLFAEAAPAGSQLLSVARHGADGGLSTWATRASDGTVRVVLINKDQTHNRIATLHLPPGSGPASTVERLEAPSVISRQGVTLGGQSYGPATTTGVLAAPHLTHAAVVGGDVTVSVPRGSAALVTVSRAATG